MLKEIQIWCDFGKNRSVVNTRELGYGHTDVQTFSKNLILGFRGPKIDITNGKSIFTTTILHSIC